MANASLYSRRGFLTALHSAATNGVQAGESAVVLISEKCLPHNGIACMTCRDSCPEEAIRFRPRLGGPFLPEVDSVACSRCGDCIRSCPADAIALVALPREARDV
jgi:ferredoxin-type protein NapF